jgi:hypothetical protein
LTLTAGDPFDLGGGLVGESPVGSVSRVAANRPTLRARLAASWGTPGHARPRKLLPPKGVPANRPPPQAGTTGQLLTHLPERDTVCKIKSGTPNGMQGTDISVGR